MRRQLLRLIIAPIGISALVLPLAVTLFSHQDIAHADGPASPPPPVPVSVAQVKRETVRVVRTGLGTVQANNTVTLRARVDGELMKVNFIEGQEVKAGDLIAQIDPRPFQAALAQAIAQKAKTEAMLLNARTDLNRFQSLAVKEYATRQSVDTQTGLVRQLEAQMQADQAQIDIAKVQLGYATITAPISGRTGARLVDAGNLIRSTEATGLVVITETSPIAVGFTLPQNLFSALNKARTKAALTVEAWREDDSEKLADGVLSLIDNQIDSTTGTIKLKAIFPNKDNALWPGQFVNAHIILDIRDNAVTTPAAAVQRGQNGPFVWLVKPDASVEIRPITLGQIQDNVALIEAGLAVGDTVVTDGQYKLRPTSKVTTMATDTGANGAKTGLPS